MNWNTLAVTPPTEEALLVFLGEGTFCVGWFDGEVFCDEEGYELATATHWAAVLPPKDAP